MRFGQKVVNRKNVLYGTAMECGAAPLKPTRRELRREERREAILDVAGAAFLEHGYGGTTMSAIASALGGSKGTLWSYFPSKELLFAAVLDRAIVAFRAQLLLTLSEGEPVDVALGKFCRMYIERLSSAPAVALYRLVISGTRRSPEVGRIFYEHGPLPTLELIGGYIECAMKRGALRSADPFLAAQTLVALCMARSQQRLLTGVCTGLDEAEVERDAADALDLFLRAYCPEAPLSAQELAGSPARS